MSKRILMFMHHYYSTNLHRGVAQYALEAGWSLNTSMYRSGEVPARQWDGVVGCFEEKDTFYEHRVSPYHIPAVSLTETRLAPCVLPDNAAIGSMGAEHLLELGYKNIAFYFWQSKAHELERAEGLTRRLNPELHRFHRINDTEHPRVRIQPMETRLRIAARAIKRLPKPLAIMAPMDDLAVELIDLCIDMGLSVPEDIGVLGVNNDRLICDFTPIPLSSIDNNEFRIGYEGAARLDRIMQGKERTAGVRRIPPERVVVRKSTDLLDIAEVPDRHVAVAVRFIADHYREPIQTKDVVATTALSKRPLQQRFLRYMGRSIHEQIMHRRIEHAKNLLRSTDYKTSHVALESGFASREHFSRAFLAATGMAPIDYRRQEH